MKLLKRLILFTLASETDFFNQSEGFEYKVYHYLYDRLTNYQQSSIRDAILQLVDSGEVDKITRNAIPLFRLTSRGRDRLLSFFTISIGQKRVWDRIWRIALLHSEKKSGGGKRKADKRKQKVEDRKASRQLRRGLEKLGFKQLSRGIYVTPLPISAKLREFLLANDFLHKLTVIESRKLLVGDDEQLANHIWQLNSLIESYTKFISRANQLLMLFKQQKSLLTKEKKAFSALLTFYFSLLEKDPGLPKKLLPADWPADLAKERFLKLGERVSELENQAKIVDIV